MKKALAPMAWTGLGAAAAITAMVAGGMVHPGRVADDDGDTPARAAQVPATVGTVALDARQLAHAALRIEAVAVGSAPVMRQGFARALDLSALAAIEAELATSGEALAASRAEANRLAALAGQDQSASRQAVEAARAQAAADAARFALAQRRVGLEFGPGLARMSDTARTHLIADVTAGRVALLRIDIPGTPLAAGTPVEIGDGQTTQTVRVIGPAAVADPQLQAPVGLAVLYPPLAAGAMAGRQFDAATQSPARANGVIVPRSALVRWQGRLWAYREQARGSFVRIAIDDARPVASGWLVGKGLTAGERIVTDGAATLFAVERGGVAMREDD